MCFGILQGFRLTNPLLNFESLIDLFIDYILYSFPKCAFVIISLEVINFYDSGWITCHYIQVMSWKFETRLRALVPQGPITLNLVCINLHKFQLKVKVAYLWSWCPEDFPLNLPYAWERCKLDITSYWISSYFFVY